MSAIRALMSGMIDYAGLFPPAALDMKTVVRNFAEYAGGDESWVLGRLVLPIGRLNEFTAIFNEVCCDEREVAWLLSVLGADGPIDNEARLAAFPQGAALVDCIELKAGKPAEVERLLSGLPDFLSVYVEFPPEKASEVLPILAQNGARAKIRLGGLTPDSFLPCEVVARFLISCADAQVPFKATAGLHHPVRGDYPLTNVADSESAKMHGFVNLFLAAALAWLGKEEDMVVATLNKNRQKNFDSQRTTSAGTVMRFRLARSGQMRRDFGADFGSCSFTEPLDELKSLGWW